ncbi:hypothetical protein BC834DRAFT_56488 [Gloeopeniophorella convolvens]|nr:hypothetical protein BC834DRAFT_56488 [Gloeopeniophorella convolvens]
MPIPHNHLAKRQAPPPPSAVGVSGGATASIPTSAGSSLILSSPGASAIPSVNNPFAPGVPVITVTPSDSTPATSSPAPPTNTPSRSSSGGSSLSTGAAIGISVGAFAIVVGAMFAFYTYYKKRSASQARQPRARGPPPSSSNPRGDHANGKDWNQLEDGDRWEGKDKAPSAALKLSPAPKSAESDKFHLFEKEPSVVSDEKANASETHNFDPSVMPDFVKYHPNLAEELSTVPPTRPYATRADDGSPVVSWDGETVGEDSFLSLRMSASDAMSPTSVAVRHTPQAINSDLHHWESAEVLTMDEPPSERPSVYSSATQNPFNDDTDSRQSVNDFDTESRKSAAVNPFFNASQHNPFSDRPSRSRKSSVSTVKRPSSVASNGTVRGAANDQAIQSLIAALDTAPALPDDRLNRASVQTRTTSIYTNATADSGIIPPPTPKAV